MKWIIANVASLVLNAILVLWGRGSFLVAVLSIGVSLWIGLPLLILSCVFFSIASRKNRTRFMNMSGYCFAVALITFSTILSIPIGGKLLAHDIRKAKAFCEDLVPKLNKVKNDTGAFPKDISELLDEARPPPFVRTSRLSFRWNELSFHTHRSRNHPGWVDIRKPESNLVLLGLRKANNTI